MKCRTCSYKKEISYSGHISCKFFIKNNDLLNESPLYLNNIPEYAKNTGWFDFPLNYDPTWITNCKKYKNSTEDEDTFYFL